MSENNMETTKVDALGNVLVIGNSYGYTTNQNGVQSTAVGILTKINASKVTIEPMYTGYGIFGQTRKRPAEYSWKRSVNPNVLFPVDLEKVNTNLLTKTIKQNTL